MTLELYADLLRYTAPGDRSALAEKLAKARCDEDRLAVLRENTAGLGGIIGTSRYWCAAWWADAVAPDYGTLAEADTELQAAVIVATRFAEHRTSVPAPKNWTIGER